MKRTISKTVKKVDILLKKMQDHIKQLDFNNYNEFKNNPDDIHDQSQNRGNEVLYREEKQVEEVPLRKDEEETQTQTRTPPKRNKDEQEETTNRFALGAAAPHKKGFSKYK